MSKNVGARRPSRAQEHIKLLRQIDEMLDDFARRGRAIVVFPKRLLIAARKP